MSEERIHRAVSDDGTEIVGRVHGQGPPVVLVHGAVADGDSEWAELLPWLTDRFTCYLPSLRGRGLSGRHPDLSREALVRDITAFVGSIGEPVALVGVSGGGMIALGVAARSAEVAALAAYEPVVFEVLGEPDRSRLRSVVEIGTEAVDAGRGADGVRAFAAWVCNDEESAAVAADPEGCEAMAESLPADLESFREALAPVGGPSPTDPATLARISAPTLLLHGSATGLTWFTESTRHVAAHVPGASVREIDGAGHLGDLFHPGGIAAELVPFLEKAARPVSTRPA